MLPILHYEPLKTIYLTTWALSLPIIRIPYWTLRYLLPSTRPISSWSLLRSVIVRVFRNITTFWTLIGFNNKRDLSLAVQNSSSALKNAKARFVWISGVDWEGDVKGEIRKAAERANVRPLERVPAYWYYNYQRGFQPDVVAESKAADGEKVILHLHGGGFFVGTAHPGDVTENINKVLLPHTASVRRLLSVDYRLSTSAPYPPSNPYPAALLDALAAYKYLIHQIGFKPENIVVSGDSAGGNLALALVRYLVENQNEESLMGSLLSTPGGLLLISPWIDLSMSHPWKNGQPPSCVRNRDSDIFDTPKNEVILQYGVISYLGPLYDSSLTEAKTNPYLSPASVHLPTQSGLFKSFPKTFVTAGGTELLLDDSLVLAERMRTDGVDVLLHVEEDAMHDFLCFFWCEPERSRTAAMIGEWVDNL